MDDDVLSLGPLEPELPVQVRVHHTTLGGRVGDLFDDLPPLGDPPIIQPPDVDVEAGL